MSSKSGRSDVGTTVAEDQNSQSDLKEVEPERPSVPHKRNVASASTATRMTGKIGQQTLYSHSGINQRDVKTSTSSSKTTTYNCETKSGLPPDDDDDDDDYVSDDDNTTDVLGENEV
jgi:hypothetical protein